MPARARPRVGEAGKGRCRQDGVPCSGRIAEAEAEWGGDDRGVDEEMKRIGCLYENRRQTMRRGEESDEHPLSSG